MISRYHFGFSVKDLCNLVDESDVALWLHDADYVPRTRQSKQNKQVTKSPWIPWFGIADHEY